MIRNILLIALFLLPTNIFAQGFTQGTIKRIEVEADLGRLIQHKAGVEISYDENGKPNATVEFETEDDKYKLIQYSVQPNSNTIILPTGTKPTKFILIVRVTNWEERTITKEYVSVTIGNNGGTPPGNEDGDEENDTPPNQDLEKFTAASAQLLKEVVASADDKEAAKLEAAAFSTAYGMVVDTEEFQEAESVNQAVRVVHEKRNEFLLGLDELKTTWNPALLGIGDLIRENKPTTKAEYKAIVLAISKAFKEASK